jgi:hypothetical protein
MTEATMTAPQVELWRPHGRLAWLVADEGEHG